MTQFYIGVKQVEAWPQAKDGREGYAVKYEDGYTSWSPADVFERAYLPMGLVGVPPGGDDTPNRDRVTQDMVDGFVASVSVHDMGRKTTALHATLRNGFEVVGSSSCVSPANYSQQLGSEICERRVKERVWELLGFVLQWGTHGLTPGQSTAR